MFDEFWKSYPRKVGKKDAMKAWSKLGCDQQRLAVEVVGTHVRYWNACETAKEYIPHPATWLNGWRFEDEIEMPAPKREVIAGWWASEQKTHEMAANVGVPARAGESWEQWRNRIRDAIRVAA